MKKQAIIFVFGILSLKAFGVIKPNQLWHAKVVVNTSTGEEDFNIQSFLSQENDSSIHIIYFKEYLKPETGELIIYTIVDTLKIETREPFDNVLLWNKENDVEFEIISLTDQKIILSSSPYTIEYGLLPEKQNNYQKTDLLKILVENDFEEYEGSSGIANHKKITFLNENHLLHWEKPEDKEKLYYKEKYPLYTEYKIIEFNGFLILKGITSYPKIVISFDSKEVKMVKYNTNEKRRISLILKKS